MMDKPAMISFDIGNTLLTLKNGQGFCSYFCAKTGYSLSQLRPLFYEHFLVENNTMGYAIEKVCEKINYYETQEIIADYSKAQLSVFEDVIPTLKRIKSLNIPIIAVSNCTPWEAGGLDEIGLGEYIDKVYYSFLIGSAKPESKIFNYVQNDINLKPEQILHIGDTLEADVMGALAVGWRAILLDRNSTTKKEKNDEYVTVKTLAQIVDLIEAPTQGGEKRV